MSLYFSHFGTCTVGRSKAWCREFTLASWLKGIVELFVLCVILSVCIIAVTQLITVNISQHSHSACGIGPGDSNSYSAGSFLSFKSSCRMPSCGPLENEEQNICLIVHNSSWFDCGPKFCALHFTFLPHWGAFEEDQDVRHFSKNFRTGRKIKGQVTPNCINKQWITRAQIHPAAPHSALPNKWKLTKFLG